MRCATSILFILGNVVERDGALFAITTVACSNFALAPPLSVSLGLGKGNFLYLMGLLQG